jgi:hypothetical protein
VVLALACVAQFMVVLDVSIVTVALPSIGRDRGSPAKGLGQPGECLLDDVLGIADAAGHPVSDGKQQRAVHLRKSFVLPSEVIWCTITSGAASCTAASTASRSRPSITTGTAPVAARSAGLPADRVVAVTW